MIVPATLAWLDLSSNHPDKQRSQRRGAQSGLWMECFHLTTHPGRKHWETFEQVHPPNGCQLPCGSPVLPHVPPPRCLFMTQRRGAADASGLSTNSWFSSALGAVWKQKVYTQQLRSHQREPVPMLKPFFVTMLLDHRHAQKLCQQSQNLSLSKSLSARCVYMD